MKRIALGFLIIASILVSSCVSKKQKEETISLSGAFALYPLAVKWAEEYKKEHPTVRFNISGGGAGKGMADALAKAVDLGMFSREISQEEKERGVWWVGLTIDAVVPTMSSQNPNVDLLKQRGLTRDEFAKIFLSESITNWVELIKTDNRKAITVYTRSDACGAAETWAKYLGGKQENLKGTGIFGDPGLAEAVINDVSAIGFNNTIYVYDLDTGKKRKGIEVVPIDINGNGVIDAGEDFYETFDNILDAVASGAYPSPPSRELYFVAKGKPEKKAVLEFLTWVLTDGQKFVKEAGYVPIDQSKIEGYLDNLR